ncbi:MAG: hypothetical protein IPH20_27250 [Bacteroidales bacterium]|nr:hypothetical protein [Bacteroidales bacterium]
MNRKQLLSLTGRFLLLLMLYYIFFIAGSSAVASFLPDTNSEPGLVSAGAGILIVGVVNTLIVMALVLSSRWSGLKLMIGLSLAYYGAVTFIMQIETWYFLSDITVNAALLPRLFLMGMPVAFLYIPLAVWILGKGRAAEVSLRKEVLQMSFTEWFWKLSLIALIYITLYWLAGYYIAWQNPDLRSFYGSPGEIVPFWKHTANTLHSDPWLFPFQVLRAMLWTLCAIPVIRGSGLNFTGTALLVGVFFSLPQNLGHIIENPLLPIASVRLSHLIETASSTFLFGFMITILLQYKPEFPKGNESIS